MKSVILLLFLLSVVYSLPIFSTSSASVPQLSSSVATSPSTIAFISSKIISTKATQQLPTLKEQYTTSLADVPDSKEEEQQQELSAKQEVEEEEEKCPANTDYNIPVERFAQLVSTHWQFDHLDSIKSNTYKIISEQFQQHIEISISKKEEEDQQQHQQQQKAFSTLNKNRKGSAVIMDMMMMDLEILHAQIFGAIQAHTEGSLHIAWDRLSDKLGQPAFEQFIKSVTLQHCPPVQDTLISSQCLKENATEISLELDQYINLNLNQIFSALEKDILPNLLNTISKDLQDVLTYFNRLFLLQDNQHLNLQVKEYSSDLATELSSLLEENTQIDVHLTDFFENYACLSRA